jgi:hypothetical protein
MYLMWYAVRRTMSKNNVGSSIDDFLKKENIFAEAQAQAIKEVVAWQLAKAMKKKISKARMAIDAVLAVLNAAEWLFGGAPTS